LTIKARSPLTPLKKGGTGVRSKSPFLRGIEGDLDSGKNQISQGFQAIVDTPWALPFPYNIILGRDTPKAHWCQLNVKPLQRLLFDY